MKLLELYKDTVMGAIKGLDRIRFRGTLRWLSTVQGMGTFPILFGPAFALYQFNIALSGREQFIGGWGDGQVIFAQHKRQPN